MNFSERFPQFLGAELYEVTDLVKSKAHFIPRGTFARMINFKDTNQARIEHRKQTLVKKSEQEILSMMRKVSSKKAPSLRTFKTVTEHAKSKKTHEVNSIIQENITDSFANMEEDI